MLYVIFLVLLSVGLHVFPVSAQQPAPQTSSPEDQLQMALAKLRWVEQSRTQCENSLGDVIAQFGKIEAERTQLKKQLEDAKGTKPDAPPDSK